MASKHTICLLPGDGIGPEVTQAAVKVIQATGVPIEWIELWAGATAVEKTGELLPQETVATLEKHPIALKGPMATPVGKGFRSINVALRKMFNLYAAVRPVRSLEGIRTRYERVELVIIRENTEGLYGGLEYEIAPGVMESLKIATREACERVARYAFKYAKEKNRKKVTVFHKANILKKTDGLFLESARKIHASEGQGIELEDMIIDNGCMQLVKDPTRFDVLLMENLYGDIVSDLCAGLVGGLGVVPGANIGEAGAIFEAVHGSAPDIAGKNLANPLACMMSGVMMLHYIGEPAAADRIKRAYNAVLSAGNKAELTKDIGGTGTTSDFVDAVLSKL